MSTRIQKKQLWAKIEEAIEKEEQLVQIREQVRQELQNVNDQLDQVWKGDCFQFDLLYKLSQSVKLSNPVFAFRECNRAVVELVYERIVLQYNTMLECQNKKILKHNIQKFEEYMNAGFPKYQPNVNVAGSCAIGFG